MNDIVCPECGWTGDLSDLEVGDEETSYCPYCGWTIFGDITDELDIHLENAESEEGFGKDLEEDINDLFGDEPY